MYFCRKRKSASTGMAAITAPAVNNPQLASSRDDTQPYSPTATVQLLSDCRMIPVSYTHLTLPTILRV